ncbi:MAG: chromate resistance protein ChrB domain-containing protein [Thermoanaerobaculia bacterium]
MRRSRPSRRAPPRPRRWYLLIHQIPPEPLYLRAKVRQRLARVGAVPLKNAVYILPLSEDCLEDLQWIAEETVAGGGEAYVCAAEFTDGRTDEAIVGRFRRERDAEYEALSQALREPIRKARRGGGAKPPEEDLPALLSRARRRFDDIARLDFFEASGRGPAQRLLRELERLARRPAAPPTPGEKAAGPAGRTWTTRRGVQVDRIASAWLIRRFVDPKARFRFVDQGEPPREGELRFDIVGGDFTHEADRCTFETLLARAGLDDPALVPVAQIVHDIDLKDGKFARPEARGVEQLLAGLLATHPGDEERLDRGFALFDELYASFRGRGARPFEKEVSQ